MADPSIFVDDSESSGSNIQSDKAVIKNKDGPVSKQKANDKITAQKASEDKQSNHSSHFSSFLVGSKVYTPQVPSTNNPSNKNLNPAAMQAPIQSEEKSSEKQKKSQSAKP